MNSCAVNENLEIVSPGSGQGEGEVVRVLGQLLLTRIHRGQGEGCAAASRYAGY